MRPTTWARIEHWRRQAAADRQRRAVIVFDDTGSCTLEEKARTEQTWAREQERTARTYDELDAQVHAALDALGAPELPGEPPRGAVEPVKLDR